MTDNWPVNDRYLIRSKIININNKKILTKTLTTMANVLYVDGIEMLTGALDTVKEGQANRARLVSTAEPTDWQMDHFGWAFVASVVCAANAWRRMESRSDQESGYHQGGTADFARHWAHLLASGGTGSGVGGRGEGLGNWVRRVSEDDSKREWRVQAFLRMDVHRGIPESAERSGMGLMIPRDAEMRRSRRETEYNSE